MAGKIPPQFLKYAAGKKHYGGGRNAPNVGKVDNAAAKAGYAKRDQKSQKLANLEAIRRKLKGKG